MSANPKVCHPLIRPLRTGDLDDVMAIEEASYPYPWTRGIFTDCLRVGYDCFGMQIASELVGYLIIHRGAGECHVLNISVHPRWRRRGLGGMLLEHGIAHARSRGCKVMFLEVRPTNPGAIGLYARRGFHEVGRRPAYYRSDEGREDAIVMRLDITRPARAGPEAAGA